MAKSLRGRAGRMAKKEENLAQYGAELARMLLSHVRPRPEDRILHIGSIGAAQFGEQLAPRLINSELILLVYTYDELEDTRAALAGIGNIHVINEIGDLDEDEPPFDIISCILPYHLGREAVEEVIDQGLERLARTGVMYIAGDKQRDLDRYLPVLETRARSVRQLSSNGQLRVVAIKGSDVRSGGRISGRRN
jgi:16S rRNA G1207 methylase RsmC